MTTRPTVAVVRGEALNPFEMQAYRPLAAEFDIVLVGSAKPQYEVDGLGLPVRLLTATNSGRVLAAASRRLARLSDRADEGRMFNLAKVLQDRQIVHAAETAIPFSAQSAEIARSTGARLVLTCWENIPFRFEEDRRVRERKRSVQRQCDLFIAVTPSARDALVAEGVDADRIVVVPAGVDTERFRPHLPTVDFRKRAGIPEGALLAVFVGRLIPEKGLVELIRAVAALPGASAPVHVLIAGKGTEEPRLRSAAEALGIADRVHVIPGVTYGEVPEMWASADIAVVPSLSTPYWQEQFGMVLVEAMASGAPVITTRSGSIPEVVGDAALVVTPYDVAELAGALADLAGDAEARRRLSLSGRSRAESMYSVDVVSQQLAAAYRRVLA